MGILNVTPDSFSDGGRYVALEAAVARGRQMVDEGADMIDVGGESTRPGADPVSAEDEMARVVPVLEALAEQTDAVLSVDTTKAAVAEAAMTAGAHVINDVSALTADADMAVVARTTGAGVVLMHRQGTPSTMQADPQYADVVRDVTGYLAQRVADVVSLGLDRRRLAVDPGIGFGKTVAHNVALLAHVDALAGLDLPVLVGLSRKSFLGHLTGREVDGRLAGSVAGLVWSVLKGAHIMRVHDVQASCDAVQVLMAIKEQVDKMAGATA